MIEYGDFIRIDKLRDSAIESAISARKREDIFIWIFRPHELALITGDDMS